VPLATSASGTLCTLSCCAGRAPHAAGSCMSGACHAVPRRSQSSRSRVHIQAAEHFCGLNRFDKVAQSSTSRIRNNPGREVIEFRSALTTPCDADCRSCGATFTSSYRGRNFAIAAYRSQSLTVQRQLDFTAAAAPIRNARSERCAPRGPPTKFA
jgi:hypothetical protein